MPSGYPRTTSYGRFEEAVEIIVPLLRAGHADFEGTFHAARDLEQRPDRAAARPDPDHDRRQGAEDAAWSRSHADIWSWFAEERSDLAEFEPRLAALVAACVEGRPRPGDDRKSAGLVIEPTTVRGSEATDFGTPIRGSPAAIADRLRAFGSAGFTQVEVMVWPPTSAALDAMAAGARAPGRGLRREGSR